MAVALAVVGLVVIVVAAMAAVAVAVSGAGRSRRLMRADDRDQSGDDRADERQEDDCRVHVAAQPFIMLTSSTAIEPRLR